MREITGGPNLQRVTGICLVHARQIFHYRYRKNGTFAHLTPGTSVKIVMVHREISILVPASGR